MKEKNGYALMIQIITIIISLFICSKIEYLDINNNALFWTIGCVTGMIIGIFY